MKKGLLLRKHVIQEVCLSALEIEPQVKDEVYVVEEKSKYAASAVQFIYNEMNRLVDYSKSRYGKTYIQRHFPKFEDDKALALDIADFYWVLLELESKGQSEISEEEEDELIGGITSEIDDFFRNFFLERHLKELAEGMNGSAVASVELSRTINEEELKKYFTPNFKGGNNWNSHNYFERELLPDLRKKRSDKDMAKIAFIIYNSNAISKQKKPTTFKEWYETFANLVGFKTHDGYKPNVLKKGIDMLEKEFSFLNSYSKSSL